MADHEREECGILIYKDGESEDKPTLGHQFSLSDFGGTLPAIGESIVSPWADGNADRQVPSNRRVWEVCDRHFLPQAVPGQPLVALIVKERPAADGERRLLGWV